MGEIVAISCSSCGWSDYVSLGSGMPGHVLNESWEKHFPEGLANKYKRAIALVALKDGYPDTSTFLRDQVGPEGRISIKKDIYLIGKDEEKKDTFYEKLYANLTPVEIARHQQYHNLVMASLDEFACGFTGEIRFARCCSCSCFGGDYCKPSIYTPMIPTVYLKYIEKLVSTFFDPGICDFCGSKLQPVSRVSSLKCPSCKARGLNLMNIGCWD